MTQTHVTNNFIASKCSIICTLWGNYVHFPQRKVIEPPGKKLAFFFNTKFCNFNFKGVLLWYDVWRNFPLFFTPSFYPSNTPPPPIVYCKKMHPCKSVAMFIWRVKCIFILIEEVYPHLFNPTQTIDLYRSFRIYTAHLTKQQSSKLHYYHIKVFCGKNTVFSLLEWTHLLHHYSLEYYTLPLGFPRGSFSTW